MEVAGTGSVLSVPRPPFAAPAHRPPQELRASVAARAPLGRDVTAAEVGALATFLASAGASGITGQTLYVDGGFSSVL